VDRMTHSCMWKPFEQTKVSTFLQLFEKFVYGLSLGWRRVSNKGDDVSRVFYDDHDYGSRLTQETEIQPPSESLCTLLGKT
jgi:hypothetical protein